MENGEYLVNKLRDLECLLDSIGSDVKPLLDGLLHVAVNTGCPRSLQWVLYRNPEIDALDLSGRTALHIAVQKKSEYFIRMLLLHGAQIDVLSSKNMTPLQLAITIKSVKIVKLLLELGANMNLETQCGLPFHIAVCTGSLDLIKLFLSRKINVDVRNMNSNTALHKICQVSHCLPQHIEACNFLIANNADVNAENNEKKTPLYCAVETKNCKMVLNLLRYTLDITIEGNKLALMKSLKHKCSSLPSISETLLKYGFTFTRNDTINIELLSDAIRNSHDKAVEELLKLGANIETLIPITIGNDTPYMTLLQAAVASNSNLNIITTLLTYGADVNVKDEHGLNLLFLAAINDDVESANELLRYGIDFNEKLEDDSTILHRVAIYGWKNNGLLDFFLKCNIDVNLKSKIGETPLHCAALSGYCDSIPLLIKYGALVNTKMKKNLTPLHIAVIYAHAASVMNLLDNGADVNIQDDFGRTPLHIAAAQGSYAFINDLLGRDANTEIKDIMDRTPYDIAVEHTRIDLNRRDTDIYHSINQSITRMLVDSKEMYLDIIDCGEDWYVNYANDNIDDHSGDGFIEYKKDGDSDFDIISIFDRYNRFVQNRHRIFNMNKEDLEQLMVSEKTKEIDLKLAREVLLMHNYEIDDNITLQDIIKKNHKQLAEIFSSEEVISKVVSACSILNYYKWTLKKQINATQEYNMSKSVCYILTRSFDNKLTDVVIRKIVDYLNKDDMESIINAKTFSDDDYD